MKEAAVFVERLAGSSQRSTLRNEKEDSSPALEEKASP
jgi:hypothetical protein